MNSLLYTAVLFTVCGSLAAFDFQLTLGHIRARADSDVQKNAVLSLINRAVPERADEFDVEIDSALDSEGKDAFTIKKEDDIVKITGTTGVAAATGFNYYLKYYMFWQIDWQVSRMNLTEEFPKVDIKIVLNDKFRYYQNVCISSYTFVWWNWKQWEKHIDWMAMNALNLVLAFNGQEAIWKRVYEKYNLTEDEIDEHFAGPAFLSWQRMGNIRGWGGPLSDSWHSRSVILQKQILQRMREFGIIPVLPAFAGHLPRAFKRLYPDANLTQMGKWNGFDDKYCCPYFLDPTDNLFKEVGKAFMEEQIGEFGTDHVYNCDSFNENKPPTTDLTYLSNVAKSIYETMTQVDNESIWLMQGWLFYDQASYWTAERAKALLTGVPLGKMIVLDLQSEEFPQYERLEQYYGQPYIWCMLHDFGGTMGNFGSISILNTRPIEARNAENSTMIGIGLTPEGINQNYVVYDFMIENAWRNTSDDVRIWTQKYVQRRYGHLNDKSELGWQQLMNTVYEFNGTVRIRGRYVLTSSPSWSIKTWSWYDRDGYTKSYNLISDGMVQIPGYENCSTCKYDQIDFMRQWLQIQIDLAYEDLVNSFNTKNLETFEDESEEFLMMFLVADSILGQHSSFLLGNWLEDAKNCANDSDDMQLYEYNARNQITLWGPKGEIINYAAKQWAGVVEDVFLPRWQLFLDYSHQVLIDNSTFNQTYIKEKIFKEVDEPFTLSNKTYPIAEREFSMDTIRKVKDRLNSIYE